MDPSRPLVLAGARYASSHQAFQDYRIVWAARRGGAFDHMSIAVLTKNACGELQVERHDSTARDLALGGAVLRAALLVVAPTAGTAMVAAGRGDLAGAGGIAAHLLHTIPKEKLQEVSQLLGSGESGLLIVAIDRRGIEISPLLEQAEKAAVIETKTGDLDAAFYGALEAATTTTGDGSEASRRALEWATCEAEARHAPLAVLSVHHWRAATHPESELDQRLGAGE